MKPNVLCISLGSCLNVILSNSSGTRQALDSSLARVELKVIGLEAAVSRQGECEKHVFGCQRGLHVRFVKCTR